MAEPRDPRLSFDPIADVYDEIRPTYPAELFDVLFAALPSVPAIIEVGAGTGQATRDLLARGAVVDAVETGSNTAATLRAKLRSPRLRVVVGDFEDADLAPSSADAVFAATAYHWIAPRPQVDRPAALLRPGGVVAIVDLIQVTAAVDRGFFAASQPIYERYGQGHRGPPAPSRGDVDPPMRAVLEDDERFRRVVVHRWDWDQTYTAAAYRKLMRSYSTTQMMDPAPRLGLLDDVEAMIDGHFGGVITRPLVVTLTMAELTP